MTKDDMNDNVVYETWDYDVISAHDKIGQGQATMKAWCPEASKKVTTHRMLYRTGVKRGELVFKTRFEVSPEHKEYARARAQLEEI